MGHRTAVRALATKIGVPILRGTEEPLTDREEALKTAKSIGFPLIIKAAFGGGGRGMRVVHKAADLSALLEEAQGEAGRAFGNPAVFLEKYIPRAKHIEVQILGDQHGNVIQCRITTEDPENKFIPDYGRILAYRSPGGFGVRLDGGMGYAGAVITPFYDSLLVKSITSGQSYEIAMNRARRVLSEFRILGVKTNIPFLDNLIAHAQFRSGQATTTLIDHTPELFAFKPRRD